MMAGDRAFGNQAATDAEQAKRMASSLDNLANAAIQKNDTVDKLVAANECLAKALADSNSALARLRLPPSAGATGASSTPPAASGGSERPCPAHWAKDKPAWDPTGYCWTHGFKVKVGHSSATCACHLEGHVATATRTNTKGGCNTHKDWTGT